MIDALYRNNGHAELTVDGISGHVRITNLNHKPYEAPSFEGYFSDDVILDYCRKDVATTKAAVQDRKFTIKKVIFNDPATIVLWADGTKTVVKCQEDDVYSEEMGLALCFAKKALGNKSNFNNIFKKHIPEKKNSSDMKFKDYVEAVDYINTFGKVVEKFFGGFI